MYLLGWPKTFEYFRVAMEFDRLIYLRRIRSSHPLIRWSCSVMLEFWLRHVGLCRWATWDLL
jgi:hypothetical protein